MQRLGIRGRLTAVRTSSLRGSVRRRGLLRPESLSAAKRRMRRTFHRWATVQRSDANRRESCAAFPSALSHFHLLYRFRDLETVGCRQNRLYSERYPIFAERGSRFRAMLPSSPAAESDRRSLLS